MVGVTSHVHQNERSKFLSIGVNAISILHFPTTNFLQLTLQCQRQLTLHFPCRERNAQRFQHSYNPRDVLFFCFEGKKLRVHNFVLITDGSRSLIIRSFKYRINLLYCREMMDDLLNFYISFSSREVQRYDELARNPCSAR